MSRIINSEMVWVFFSFKLLLEKLWRSIKFPEYLWQQAYKMVEKSTPCVGGKYFLSAPRDERTRADSYAKCQFQMKGTTDHSNFRSHQRLRNFLARPSFFFSSSGSPAGSFPGNSHMSPPETLYWKTSTSTFIYKNVRIARPECCTIFVWRKLKRRKFATTIISLSMM